MTKFQINKTYSLKGNGWAWTLQVQKGHIYHVSPSFPTFGECLVHMQCHGESVYEEAEAKLRAMGA